MPDDDFTSNYTSMLWGPEGRGDLSIIRSLGANAVRLYGNDVAFDKTGFLNEALLQGLSVIAGISDYPYLQMPGNCAHTDFNCYSQVFDSYRTNLEHGFLVEEGGFKVYHPALLTIILMNEPDLKFQPPMRPQNFCRALVSAFDALLDAEKEFDVVGAKPNITATFSFGVCPWCTRFQSLPGLGQLDDLRSAMQDPRSVGYTARNDLWQAYQARFENSVNTANPAESLHSLFLKPYQENFQGMPVFIAEYHSPSAQDQQADLEAMLRMANDESTLLKGFSFFEFQARYDKGGAELGFGMFGLGEQPLGEFTLTPTSWNYTAWCLTPLAAPRHLSSCPQITGDVEYVPANQKFDPHTWGYDEANVARPEVCCGRCLELPVCNSWTWVPNTCRMSGSQPPKSPVSLQGAVSGSPGERPRILPGDGAGGASRAMLLMPGILDLLSEEKAPRYPPVPEAVSAAFGGSFPEAWTSFCPATAIQYL